MGSAIRSDAAKGDGRVGLAVAGSLGPGAAEEVVDSDVANNWELDPGIETAELVAAAAVDTRSNSAAVVGGLGSAEQRFLNAD